MADEFFPEEGDLVVCTVKSVRNFGAFVELEEYPDKEGFIHVAEIATGWVKRMSDYVRDGQRIVCKVMKIEKAKGHFPFILKNSLLLMIKPFSNLKYLSNSFLNLMKEGLGINQEVGVKIINNDFVLFEEY